MAAVSREAARLTSTYTLNRHAFIQAIGRQRRVGGCREHGEVQRAVAERGQRPALETATTQFGKVRSRDISTLGLTCTARGFPTNAPRSADVIPPRDSECVADIVRRPSCFATTPLDRAAIPTLVVRCEHVIAKRPDEIG